MMEVHSPPNTLLRIDGVWAFVSVDADGHEGLCAMPTSIGLLPMVAADSARLLDLVEAARHLATISGMTIRLIKLGMREEVAVFEPGAGAA